MALLEAREELSPGSVEIRKIAGRGISHRKGRRGKPLLKGGLPLKPITVALK